MDKKVKEINDFMPTVEAQRVLKILTPLKNFAPDAPVSLEFILTALFPSVWENIKTFANDCYTNGYIQGKEDAQNESKRNN